MVVAQQGRVRVSTRKDIRKTHLARWGVRGECVCRVVSSLGSQGSVSEAQFSVEMETWD